jgi:hypothetical protein
VIVSRHMRTSVDLASAIVLTALVGGCGQSTSVDPGATHTTHVSKSRSAATGGQASDAVIDPDMVSAVNLNGSGGNVFSMKFKLESRPAVTTPLEVTVLMIPAPAVEIIHVHMLFQPGDGLLLSTERDIDRRDLATGAPIEQRVTVVPQQSGVLNLNATVLVDTATESVSRTYAIPVIASDTHS